jgi:hypothetical protein
VEKKANTTAAHILRNQLLSSGWVGKILIDIDSGWYK